MTSKDGTRIAYERIGKGPAVILVTGNLDDGAENAPLAAALARRFTVYNYARRGRGHSGDTLPYAVERELEDIEALMGGAPAHLYGVSSGGALVLEAAIAGLAVDRLAVYEVPFDIADDTPRQQREYSRKLDALLAAGRRGDAVELFMRLAGSSDAEVAGARASEMWPGLEAIAHTLAYDAACLGDRRPHPERLATIKQRSLILTGGSIDPFEHAADAIAASVPNAERVCLTGASHMIDAATLAPVLEAFFLGRHSS